MIFKIIITTQPEGCAEDARVHCVVLKVRAEPFPTSPHGETTKGPEVRILIRSLRTNSVQAPHPQDIPFLPPKQRTKNTKHP